MKNYHLIEVRYLGPTTHRGSRVKLVSHRFRQSITLPYDHAYNSSLDLALDYLEKNGHNVLGSGEVNGRDVIVVGSVLGEFKGLK